MDKVQMNQIGHHHRDFVNCETTLSDRQLKLQIEALDLVIAYLKGRGDSGLIVFPLILDKEKYIGFQNARSSDKNWKDDTEEKVVGNQQIT